MSETHLRLEVKEGWQVDEHDVDVDVDVDMQVDGHLTGFGWAGVVSLVIGSLLVAIASLVFVLGYPEKWYAVEGSIDSSRSHVRFVVTAAAVGAIALFQGASLYFFGRRTSGTGSSGAFRLEAQ